MNEFTLKNSLKTVFKCVVVLFVPLFSLVACASVSEEFNDVAEDVELTDTEADAYTYELPIIFHVLYNDKSDENQYVPQSRLAEIVDNVNSIYDGDYGGEDINLNFYLAETDESGSKLSEAGVNRVYVSGDYPINQDELMGGVEYKDILWDPNSYINVLLFEFEDSNVMGVSHLPFMYYGSVYKLDGINTSQYTSLTLSNLSFTYCLAINNQYIYVESDDNYYYEADVNCTLAHELGHYLGLLHVFSEEEDGSDDEDVDYCEDTPTYNRATYIEYVEDLFSSPFNKVTFYDLIQRTSVSGGVSYDSDNVLDYSYSYSNVFTSNQSERMRTILQYGLMIPGPKVESDTKAVNLPEGVVDLPFTIVNCELKKESCCSH